MVSPGAIGLAPVLRRLNGAVSESVPLAIVLLVLVELVKVAKVPRPAIDAAAPRAASESRIFLARKEARRMMVLLSAPAARRPSLEGGFTEVN
jgi:hypothetical protein